MTRDEAIRIAERIAAGHAFDKHVVEREEFPGISTREEFEALILEALTHPDEERKLERGRHAYRSARHSAIIIVDEGANRTEPPSDRSMAWSIFGAAYSKLMKVLPQSGCVALALSREQAAHANNVLHEACNGFAIANFEAAIGLTRAQAAGLLRRVQESFGDSARHEAINITLPELDGLRHALTAVLADLDAWEYATRMGFEVAESETLRNRLDTLAGEARFGSLRQTA
jgi:hypothetical protein